MSGQPELRCASVADLANLHALVERAYRGASARRGWTHEADLLDGQRTDKDALAAILGDPRQRVLVADADNSIAGCVQVSSLGDDLAYLGMLSVDPSCQAGGLGKRLIAAAERLSVDLFDARSMEMTVIRQRSELVAYYERRGYRRTGETRPFPYGDERFGQPRRSDLEFVVLAKALAALPGAR